jgi:SAM-dependent methyltransferase
MLVAYGMKVGGKLLLKGQPKLAVPYLGRPVNYWRAIEYRLISDAANFRPGDRVLDIGSPKLLSLYLAKVVGAEVFATDIDDYFVERQQAVAAVEGVPPDRLHIRVEDGRNLSFADETFDKVFSLSVVEHIPDDGDTACIREIARVLMPGGECYLTVPFWPRSRTDYLDDKAVYWAEHSVASGDGKVFYQRRYSEDDLFARLIAPSALELKELKYVGEKVMTDSDGELSDHLPLISGPIQPLLSKLLHTKPSASWRELAKPLCALVVLRKPESSPPTLGTDAVDR